MRTLISMLAAGSALAVAACSQPTDGSVTANAANMMTDNSAVADNESMAAGEEVATGARASVATAEGAARGEVTASTGADGLRVSFAATGMPAGTYGVHVHTTGRCDGPKFDSAGAHWNPAGKAHGRENPAGAHLGDLPNLTVAADGTGRVDFTIPGAMLSGGENALLDADGAAFLVHAKPDDYRTDPSGSSGDRIACGVFASG